MGLQQSVEPKLLLVLAETKGVKSRSKPIFGLLYRPVSTKTISWQKSEKPWITETVLLFVAVLAADGWNVFLTNSVLTSVSSSSTCFTKFPMMRSHPSSSQQVKDCNCCLCSPSVFGLGSFFLCWNTNSWKQESNLLQNCISLNVFYFSTLL